MVRRRSRIIIVIAAAIIVVGGIIVLTLVNARRDTTPAAASFAASGSGASIIRASDHQTFLLNAGKVMPIHAGDVLQGNGILTFNGAQVELAPTAQIILTHYSLSDLNGPNQIDIDLNTGQVLQQITGQVLYTVNTPSGSLVAHGGKYIAFIDNNGLTQFGSVYGAASVSGAGHSLVLTDGEGTTLATGSPPTDPKTWSSLDVTTFQPDGSAQTLSAMLTSNVGNNQFYFQTGQPVIVPPGTYNLKIMALVAYEVNGLVLDTETPNEFPVTMAQAVFTTVDETGTPVSFSGLNLLSGDQRAHVAPQQPVLISPGNAALTITNDNKPDAILPIMINVLPGQKATIPLRTALFGGGSVKLVVSAPDGVTVDTMDIKVYKATDEDGDPVDTFSSDSKSSLLPPGNYIVIVPTDISGRYPITIANNQDVTVEAKLGTLSVSFKDASGNSTNPYIYVGSVSDMQRLSLPIDKIQQTKFGVYGKTNTKLLVPEGNYNIRVDAPGNTMDVNGVEVQDRQNLVLPIDGSNP